MMKVGGRKKREIDRSAIGKRKVDQNSKRATQITFSAGTNHASSVENTYKAQGDTYRHKHRSRHDENHRDRE